MSLRSVGSSSIWVLQYFRSSIRNAASVGVTKLMAVPVLPKRPDRPILWMQVSFLVGRSQLMIRFTCCTSIPLPSRSVVMSTLDDPVLNSVMVCYLSTISRSPWMQDTTKFFSLSLVVSSLTRSFLLVKIMHCAIVRFLQSSTSVSNLYSSLSIEIKYCLIPSRVSCSFLTRILMGLRRNWLVISRISGGMVAENKATWISEGTDWKTVLMSSIKPRESISSASSSTSILRWSVLINFLVIMSTTLPGVPTTTWMPPSFSFFLSSATLVPPTQVQHTIFRYCARHMITLWVCCASYLAGAIIKACIWGDLASIRWRTPIENVAVFPVPDCAWAMVSLALMTGRIPRCWMTDGFSKPQPQIPLSKSSCSPSSSNVSTDLMPSVSTISVVQVLVYCLFIKGLFFEMLCLFFLIIIVEGVLTFEWMAKWVR